MSDPFEPGRNPNFRRRMLRWAGAPEWDAAPPAPPAQPPAQPLGVDEATPTPIPVIGPLLDRLVQARQVAGGSRMHARNLASGPAGAEDVDGARRAREQALQLEQRAKSDEALLAELQALPSRVGAPMWRETGNREKAQAYMDALTSRGFNAGIDGEGRITWGTPSAPEPMVQQQQAAPPMLAPPGQEIGGRALSQALLSLDRITRALDNERLSEGARAALQRQAERISQHIAGSGGGPQVPAGYEGVEDLVSGWEQALSGGGAMTQDPRAQQLHARLSAAFARRFGRQPDEREMYVLWAQANGLKGGRR